MRIGGWMVMVCALAVAQGAEVHWRKSNPLPDARAGYAAGALDGKLIIAGGCYWEGSKGHWVKKLFTARVDAFDPPTEKWTRLPDMPAPLAYAASAVVDGKLYAIGGYDGKAVSSAVYTLNRAGGAYRWREVGKLPGPKVFAHAAAMGRSIALIAGMTRFEPYDATGTCCTSVSATRDVLLFDTAQPAKGWQARAPYPGHARWLWVVEAHGDRLWIAGGTYQEKPKGANRWAKLGVLPKEVMDTQAVTSGWLVGAGGENKVEGPRRRSEWTFAGSVQR